MDVSLQPDPCLVVIFGASGDLTKRKLIPALYDLYVGKQLPKQFAVLGMSRTDIGDDPFRDRLEEFAKQFAHQYDPNTWNTFAKPIYYHAADSTKPEAYEGIKSRMAELAEAHGTGAERVVVPFDGAAPLRTDHRTDRCAQHGHRGQDLVQH